MSDPILLAGQQPVFPMSERVALGERERVTVVSTGLTLRDLFALEAMKVELNRARDQIFRQPAASIEKIVADRAYSMADAMLDRRGVAT